MYVTKEGMPCRSRSSTKYGGLSIALHESEQKMDLCSMTSMLKLSCPHNYPMTHKVVSVNNIERKCQPTLNRITAKVAEANPKHIVSKRKIAVTAILISVPSK